MAGSTPIYGFPYPEPSDLVANYPALGQQLAEDIEDVLPTLGALSLVATATPTGVASVSVNNCFSATYETYRIVANLTSSSTQGLLFVPRASGTDITTNVFGQRIVGSSTSVTAASGSSWTAIIGVGLNATNIVLDWSLPFVAAKSSFVGLCNQNTTIHIAAGTHEAATSYDGFTLSVGSGTITGTIRVYGYKNS